MSTWGMIQSGRRAIAEIEQRLTNERNTVNRAHMLSEIAALQRQICEDLAEARREELEAEMEIREEMESDEEEAA
jgi:hypothetical protein